MHTNTKLPRSHTESKGNIATDTELYRLYTGRVDGYNGLPFPMPYWEPLANRHTDKTETTTKTQEVTEQTQTQLVSSKPLLEAQTNTHTAE